MKVIDRRSTMFLGASLLLPGRAFARNEKITAKQFHNQPAGSPLDDALKQLWKSVAEETRGALAVTVYPQNNKIPGSDPAALKMLVSGELEFYTLMGGILSQVVPVMDIQGLPYAFKTVSQVYHADSGALGRYLDQECRAKGIHRIRGGLLENGFRQMNMVEKPITKVDDMAGVKIRVPDGDMFRDFFTTVGASPVTMNINKLYDALKDHTVDGQENPLVIAETNKFYEVTKIMSMTNHMWSGFNLLSNGAFWNRLPDNVKASIAHNVAKVVPKQRKISDDLNQSLEKTLSDRGMVFNKPDIDSFRSKLGNGFYARWRKQLGEKAWTLLESSVGKLG